MKKLSILLPLLATVTLNAHHNNYYDPFEYFFGNSFYEEIERMQKEMNRAFEKMQQQRYKYQIQPKYPTQQTKRVFINRDFIDKGDHYLLKTQIPEMKKGKVDIKTENSLLKIYAKESIKTAYSSSISIYQEEYIVPKNGDIKTIKIDYKNGFLVVYIDKIKPKKAVISPKDINKTK